jgi:hypothetical protein
LVQRRNLLFKHLIKGLSEKGFFAFFPGRLYPDQRELVPNFLSIFRTDSGGLTPPKAARKFTLKENKIPG